MTARVLPFPSTLSGRPEDQAEWARLMAGEVMSRTEAAEHYRDQAVEAVAEGRLDMAAKWAKCAELAAKRVSFFASEVQRLSPGSELAANAVCMAVVAEGYAAAAQAVASCKVLTDEEAGR